MTAFDKEEGKGIRKERIRWCRMGVRCGTQEGGRQKAENTVG